MNAILSATRSLAELKITLIVLLVKAQAEYQGLSLIHLLCFPTKSSSTSQQLVALIPYDDERLKPKKTAVYVTLAISGAVLACGVIAGLLVYFMMPRPVEINMVGVRRPSSQLFWSVISMLV